MPTSATFNGFPLYTAPLVHTDRQGRLTGGDDQNHTLAQGWIQGFASIAEILSGNWHTYTFIPDATGTVIATPWQVTVSLDIDAITTLTLPVRCSGVLILAPSAHAITVTEGVMDLPGVAGRLGGTLVPA